MKILKRRAKAKSATATTLSERSSRYQNMAWSRWQALPTRDQLALAVLMTFLLLLVGGYGGYSVNQMAHQSKIEYQEHVADYFWLRAQATNINSRAQSPNSAQDGDASLPPASQISALLNTSGIHHAQVIATGESVQLSFNDASQSIISSALGQLQTQGWQFSQLSMQQDVLTKQIQVQATVVW